MTRKKPAGDPSPVTVAELLLALASLPQSALVWTTRSGEIWADVDPSDASVDSLHCVWEGHVYTRPAHYERADVVVQVVERDHPGDDYATANEFLEWLRRQSIGLTSAGQGHNETDSPLPEVARARLAEEFAGREVTP